MKHFSTKRMASLLLLSLVTVSAVFAAPRTEEQAKQIAQQQMNKNAAKKVKGQGSVAAVNPQLAFSKKKIAKADDAYYYVFSAGRNLGYTIVSGDDRFPAIVGYTEQGDYDANNLPTNLVSFMQAYQDFVDNATEAQIAEINAWKEQIKTYDKVEPFMQEKWDQGDPYNRMCPEYNYDISSVIYTEKAVTGCVATAAAQILHYHKCAKLMEEIPAYSFNKTVNTTSNNISMSAISAGQIYDLENMLNVYKGNETEEQKDAVAKLMLHVGCAVQMSYGPSSSANASAETFTKYFGMDKELTRYLHRSEYQLAEWNDMLCKELEAGRPVYYSGQSTGGGHAFVIHGYEDKDGLYYVNWGWGGYCDGYFDITILNPYSTSGAGASSSDDGYSMDNGMILVVPDNKIEDDVETSAELFTCKEFKMSDPTINSNKVEAMASIFITNTNASVHSGYINVAYKKTEDDIELIGQNAVYYSLPQFYFNSNPIKINVSFEYENDKIYDLYLVETQDNGAWQICKGQQPCARISVKDNKAELVSLYVLEAKVELDAEEGGYATMSNSINVTVNNTGEKEYYDKITVMVKDVDGTESAILNQGITVPVNGSTTFSVAYTPKSGGTYNFWILDVDNKVISKTTSITFEDKPADAKLSIVSLKCVNSSGYKTYASYAGANLEMDIIDGTEAKFEIKIKNEGGYYKGTYYFNGIGQVLTLPGNQTSTFEFTVQGSSNEVISTGIGYPANAPRLDMPQEVWNTHKTPTGGSYSISYEICYLAGDGKNLPNIVLTGNFDDTANSALHEKLKDNKAVTYIDLRYVNGITVSNAEIETSNPNALIYINDGSTIANTKNVVVQKGYSYTCDNLELTDAMPFNTGVPFTATKASYTRNLSDNGWYSICLPYGVVPEEGVEVEEFKTVNTNANTVTFETVEKMDANKPYIFKADGKATFNATNVTVAVTPEVIKDATGCFIGTYEGIVAPNLEGFYVLNSDGTGFGVATDKAWAAPFRAYINIKEQANVAMLKVIHGGGDGTTGITEVGTAADNADEYYNLNGVKVTTPQKGIYIKNGKKYIFK